MRAVSEERLLMKDMTHPTDDMAHGGKLAVLLQCTTCDTFLFYGPQTEGHAKT